jgi:O-antigen/teichoic acid export membrane protein
MIKNIFGKYFTDSFFLNVPLGINTVISLLTLPVVLGNLPIDEYGKWQFVIAIQVWLTAFTAGNITAASKRGIAQGLKGTFLYAFFARSKLLIPAGILTLAVAYYLNISGEDVISALLLIMGAYLIFGYLFQVSFYEYLVAIKDFRALCLWQIFISSVSMIGSAIAALLTSNIILFALSQLGSISVLSFVAWTLLIKKEMILESYKKGDIDRDCVDYGLKMIPASLASVTSGKVSHFIIPALWGYSDLAVFSVAQKLRDKSSAVIKSLRPLLYADFARLEKKELTIIGIIPDLLKIILILLFGYVWQIMGVCIALAAGGLISFGFYYFLTIRRYDNE